MATRIGSNYPEISIEETGVGHRPDCFCIRYDFRVDRHDLIHICDWPAMKAAIDDFQHARGGNA